MKRSFPLCIRIVILATLLCVCTVPSIALAKNNAWQTLMNEYAVLTKQGQYQHALEIARKTLKLAEGEWNREPKNVFLSLNMLGSTYSELGQYVDAFPIQQRALAISEKAFGPEHPDTALALNNLGETYLNLARYDEARVIQKRALAIREETIGSEHPDTAKSLKNLALIYVALAKYDEALPLQQRALAINENAFGFEHKETIDSLLALAEIFGTLAQYDKALPLQKRALEISEKLFGLEHPDNAKCLDNLASTFNNLAQHDQALPLLERALAISEKTLGAEHPDTGAILNNLAATHIYLAQYDKALPFQHRALAIAEKIFGGEHPKTATGLNNLAVTYGYLAKYEKALPFQKRALEIREKSLGPEHPDTALSLSNLSRTYTSLAQFDKVLPLQTRALDIIEKTFGAEHPNTGVMLNNLAATHIYLTQYDKALRFQKRVLAIREKSLGSEHPDTAKSLDSLAGTYSYLAQYDKALPLQKRAFAILEKSLGPEHPDTAKSLNSLARTYSSLAQFDKVLPLQKRVLAILEKSLGPEHPDTAMSLISLAETYSHLVQFDKVLPLQNRALAVFEKSLGPEHPDTAMSLNSLGGTYMNLAQYDKALSNLQRALVINERSFGSDHFITMSGHSLLAAIFFRIGQPDMAVTLLKLTINTLQREREKVSRIGAPELLSYTERFAKGYQILAALLIEQGLLPDAQLVLDMLKENEQFEFVRRSSSADPRLSRIGYNSNEQIWMTRYRQIADRLAALGVEERALQKQAKLGLSTEQKQRQQTLASDLRIAQTAFESFLKEMQESFVRQGQAKAVEANATSVAALGELQSLLKGIGNESVLLQYYITDDKVGMLLTTPGVQLARSTKVSAKELNRQIADFRRLLRDPKSDLLKASQALYQLLVAPVAKDLEQTGAKTVMLSLDGALRYLPFGALHDGQRYLMQRWNLPMYTSVTKNRLKDTATPKWQVAGLGVTKSVGEFAALPAVKSEMRSIIKTASSGVLPGEVYLDEAFSALRFKDVSQRPFQLLHVASHFRFSPGTEVNSFLLLGDGQQLTLGDIRTQNFRFDNVDLLTLSACDTALGGGRDAQGREIEGFGVIAQHQGAKAVLATLWPVADQSTATLMAEMYRRRQEQNLTKIEALRQAQLSLLSQSRYAHPFYWAPFILMGNWK